MAGRDRRTIKTTRAILGEVLDEMQVKKFNQLTISGICRALDISRRTFYLHFSCIEDVFKLLFEEINAPLYAGFDALQRQHAGQRPDDVQLVREIFNLINATIERNRDYLTRIAIEPSYGSIQMMHVNLMKDMIMQYLRKTPLESRMRKVYLDYFISGILELYMQWYRGVSALSLDDIRDFACSIIQIDMENLPMSAPE